MDLCTLNAAEHVVYVPPVFFRVHALIQRHSWALRVFGLFHVHSQDLSNGKSDRWTVGRQLWMIGGLDICAGQSLQIPTICPADIQKRNCVRAVTNTACPLSSAGVHVLGPTPMWCATRAMGVMVRASHLIWHSPLDRLTLWYPVFRP